MSTPRADLATTRAALRTEIGPETDRDPHWQPMVSAGEIRAVLDALDAAEIDARQARAELRAQRQWSGQRPTWPRDPSAPTRGGESR